MAPNTISIFLFLTPCRKTCHYFGALKISGKKTSISENYNVHSAVVPNLVNVFCHHQKRPTSGLRWVD